MTWEMQTREEMKRTGMNAGLVEVPEAVLVTTD